GGCHEEGCLGITARNGAASPVHNTQPGLEPWPLPWRHARLCRRGSGLLVGSAVPLLLLSAAVLLLSAAAGRRPGAASLRAAGAVGRASPGGCRACPARLLVLLCELPRVLSAGAELLGGMDQGSSEAGLARSG